jgi:hypothetical protein
VPFVIGEHVRVDDNGSVWYGQVVRPLGGAVYRIRLGGTGGASTITHDLPEAMLSPIIPGRRVAPRHNAARARANWHRLANLGRNQAVYGNTIPGGGRLGVAGTRGGETGSLTKYFDALAGNADFPYRWRIAGNDFQDLIDRRPVTARAMVQGMPDLKPIMRVPFVMLRRGEAFIGPVLRIGGSMTVNHIHLARLASRVLFAGQMEFIARGVDRHTLVMWNNESGGYRSTNAQAAVCGLPMNIYQPVG